VTVKSGHRIIVIIALSAGNNVAAANCKHRERVEKILDTRVQNERGRENILPSADPVDSARKPGADEPIINNPPAGPSHCWLRGMAASADVGGTLSATSTNSELRGEEWLPEQEPKQRHFSLGFCGTRFLTRNYVQVFSTAYGEAH
jgi:hypothetical protein